MSVKHYAHEANKITRRVLIETWQRYKKMGWKGKAFIWFFIIIHIIMIGTIIHVGPKRIFQIMYDLAQKLRHMRYGWLILASIAVVTSFPPLLGYSTTMTICGFAYGPLGGLAIAGPSAIIGSALTFIILRTSFKPRIKSWTQQNRRWQAMEQVIDAKGLPLIIMIRLCPIPWVYSNALFASMESVKLWQFVIATICLMPKLFLVIFVGSQVANLSDGKTRGEMSTLTKVLDVFSIILTGGLAVGTGAFVWRKTQEKIRHMQGPGLSDDVDREAADALDDATRPLLVHALSGDELDSDNESPLEDVVSQLSGRPRSKDERV